MHYWFFFTLLIASAIMVALELRGAKVVLQLSFKGDIKRESLWLQQWGQLVATFFVMLFIYSFETNTEGVKKSWSLALAVFTASMICFAIKRTVGRVRPNRENAGKFLGPSLKHANWRESFPSSHSACAVALSVGLTEMYPQATLVLWFLGICCAMLRYFMDAHWPADVLAGIAIGYACGHLVMNACGYHSAMF
jgi:membrane-associated phospholipid phosphatase